MTALSDLSTLVATLSGSDTASIAAVSAVVSTFTTEQAGANGATQLARLQDLYNQASYITTGGTAAGSGLTAAQIAAVHDALVAVIRKVVLYETCAASPAAPVTAAWATKLMENHAAALGALVAQSTLVPN